jgi:hypothetical protein
MRSASPPLGVLACLGLVLAGAPALAAKKTDVVVMRNGDRITCEVDDLERGQLSVKTDDMGTLGIEWDKVSSVEAAAQFDLEDLAGRRYVGSLQSTAVAGQLRIVSVLRTSDVNLVDIARINRLGATFWKRLDGSLDIGASYTSASELFKLDVSAIIGIHKPGFDVKAAGSASFTSQPGVDDTSRSVFSLGYLKRFQGRWVAVARGQLEENRELGFDLRSSVMAGAGRYLLQRRRDGLIGSVGLSLNREKPVDGESKTNLELTALLNYDRFAYDFPKVDVTLGAAGFLSLTESGRYRFEFEGRLKRELVRDFYLSLQGYESYDSRPPTEDAAGNDWGLTFALGWSF